MLDVWDVWKIGHLAGEVVLEGADIEGFVDLAVAAFSHFGHNEAWAGWQCGLDVDLRKVGTVRRPNVGLSKLKLYRCVVMDVWAVMSNTLTMQVERRWPVFMLEPSRWTSVVFGHCAMIDVALHEHLTRGYKHVHTLRSANISTGT